MKRLAIISLTSLAWVLPAAAETYAVDYTLQWRSAEEIRNDTTPLDSDELYQLSTTASTSTYAGEDSFRLTPPKSGLTYLTRIRLSNDTKHLDFHHQTVEDDDPRLISRLYQIGYGGQSANWYGGVNLSVEQFSSDYDRREGDLWAFGIYAGSRLALTGLGKDAPLWTLSLTGEYDRELFNDRSTHDWVDRGKWFITPGVYWSAESFSLKAGVQVPLDERRDLSSEDPDYRLRADFETRF